MRGRFLVATTCAFVLVLAGCTSDDDSAGDDQSDEDATDASDASDSSDASDGGGEELEGYAEDFCVALGEWGSTLADGVGAIEGMTEALETAEAGPESLDDAFALLDSSVQFFEETASATRDLIDALEDLGPADVDGGEEFQEEFLSGLETTEEAFTEMAEVVGDVDLTDPEARAAADQEFEDLSGELDALDSAETPGELEDTLEDSEACQEVEETFQTFE